MPNPVPTVDSGLRRAEAHRWKRLRFVPTLATVIAIAVFVAAGNWQKSRMQAKEAQRAQYDAAIALSPLALATVPASADWTSLRYRSVTATGDYVAAKQMLIDNKVVAGRAGYHVVTPLALRDGRIVLVNRGWIPQRASRTELPQAPPPTGEVTVRGRIAQPPAGYLELKPDATSGSLRQNLDPARFAADTGLPVLPVVVEATEGPAPDDGLVRVWPAPDFGIDTHRVYMMQWYAFALMAALLWLWFHRPRAVPPADG